MRKLLIGLLVFFTPLTAFAFSPIITNSSDTLNIFRTNTNTNFTNLTSDLTNGLYSFSTTSANYWSSLGLGFSTTSANYWGGTKNYLAGVTADSPLSGSGTSGSHLTITQSGIATNGYLSSTDWNFFNNKIGSSSLSGSSPITYNSSTGVIACPTCSTGSAAFPFTQTTFGATNANATSTLIGFTAGLYSLASSTIGNGLQAGGLTISGGATTTGNGFFTNTVGIGSQPGSSGTPLTIQGVGVNSEKLKVLGSSNPTTYAALGDQSSGSNGWYLGLYIGGILKTRIDSQGSSYVPLNFGAGSTSPYARLSVHANNGDTNQTLFAIGSSTQTATSTLFSVDNTGSTTIANGVTITAGCFKVNGSCITSGVSDHSLLTNLAWTSSGHTGTANSVAAFNPSGATVSVSTSTLFGVTTPGYVLAYLNGANTFVATTTFNSPLAYSGGAVSCASCLTANQSITLSGVVTGSGSTAITTSFGTQNAGVLGAVLNGLTTSVLATSTLYGAGGIPNSALASYFSYPFPSNATSTPLTINFASTTAITASGEAVIPNGAGKTLANAGEIGISTTADQLHFYGTAQRVVPYFQAASFSYATTTAWTGTTTISLGTAAANETWKYAWCFTDVGTVQVSFKNNTSRMDWINASTTVGTTTLVTNNAIPQGTKRYVDVGTPATSPTTVSCTIQKSYDAN